MDNREIWEQVRSQAAATPAIYGVVDFASIPERLVIEPGQPHDLGAGQDALRERVLALPGMADRMRAYTFMGDRVADPYAALMPQFGFKRLVEMVTEACEHGVESVKDAPAELHAFIAAMEKTPDWLDMKLVEEGARHERAPVAILSPISIRAAFIATFVNRYAALPMALTGTLSSESAARRVKETSTFFSTSVLPGALARNGEGFKAAAMVRLMHSMVRFNAMRKGRWDVSVYGIPIPQVDQMPAGLIASTSLATAALHAGRKEFTPAERARVELSRYRCYLLGLPETLLKTTPEEIMTLAVARQATLRPGFDDATCGSLLRATLGAYLPQDRGLVSRGFNGIETGFSKVFFVKQFATGDLERARQMGVTLTAFDRFAFLLAASVSGLRLAAYGLAARMPGLREIADRRLVAIIRRQLASYGRAHFTTDASAYRPAVTATPH
ncbi:MAG: DUF2236 domain-containing protein [Rhizobiaceae bacterium]|nr:DUF2236 domain-containing protein [Rhizobiaceae bacterium]